MTAVINHRRKGQSAPACAWLGANGFNPLNSNQKLTINSNKAIGTSNK
jgi:hypothetical protein